MELKGHGQDVWTVLHNAVLVSFAETRLFSQFGLVTCDCVLKKSSHVIHVQRRSAEAEILEDGPFLGVVGVSKPSIGHHLPSKDQPFANADRLQEECD